MHSAIFVESFIISGKLTQPFRTETIDMGSCGSKRLHIRDISSGFIYLIDTGSDISLFPAGPSILKNRPCDLVLYVANDSRVATYGSHFKWFNLSHRHRV